MTLPSEDDLADDLLGCFLVEIALATLVIEVVHEVQHSIRSQDLVVDLGHEQDAALILQDGRRESGPHLHSDEY